VAKLLEKGADVNAKNKDDMTALILASERRNKDIVELLLTAGAVVNAQDKNGRTALIAAIAFPQFLSIGGDTEIVEMLLDANADMNAQDIDGSTALIIASQEGHTDCVSTLLGKGADVNMQSNAGKTALLAATRRHRIYYLVENPRQEYLTIMKLLIQKGATIPDVRPAGFPNDDYEFLKDFIQKQYLHNFEDLQSVVIEGKKFIKNDVGRPKLSSVAREVLSMDPDKPTNRIKSYFIGHNETKKEEDERKAEEKRTERRKGGTRKSKKSSKKHKK
jgi:ankyrin repeat protein